MPYVGRDLQRGNYLKLDDISSSFNGSTTTFNLTSGGNAFFPGSAFSIIVSLGGVIQEPESAFQIDKSQIIFAQAPTASSDFFCIALGVALGVGVPGHNTVGNDHLAKPLSYGDYFRWDSVNNRVGINTLLPSTALDVVGDATFSGAVSIGGTLTYEDVANIDAVGIITARAGIEDKTLTAGRVVYTGTGGRLVDNSGLTFNPTTLNVPGLNVTGITTFGAAINVTGTTVFNNDVTFDGATAGRDIVFDRSDNQLEFAVNAKIRMGGSYPLTIYNDTNSYITQQHQAALFIESKDVQIYGSGGGYDASIFIARNGVVELGYEPSGGSLSTQLKTVGYGITVFGTTETQKLNVTGITTLSDSVRVGGHLTLTGTPHDYNYGRGAQDGGLSVYAREAAIEVVGDDDGGHGGSVLIRTPTEGFGFVINPSTNSLELKAFTSTGDNFTIHNTGQNVSNLITQLRVVKDGAVELYNNGTKQCETYSAGLDIALGKVLRVSHANATDGNDGTISSGVFNEGLTFVGTQTVSGNGRQITHYGNIKPSNNNQTSLGSSSNQYGYLHSIRLMARYDSNSTGLYIGASDDIRSYHDGTDSWFTNKTGNFRIGNTHNDEIKFLTQGSTRWNIDGSGHFVPDTAGAVNIGSASVGIGSVFLADDKKISLGNGSDFEISHSGGVNFLFSPNNRQLQLKGDGGLLIRAGGNQLIANFLQSAVTLYHNVGNLATARLITTSTGVTVGGEVAATQDYPDFKPALDLNFAQNQTLDPRITYSRVGTASFTDENGRLRWVGSHVPRFDHEPGTGKPRGLLIEAAGTNIMRSYQYYNNQNLPYGTYFSNTNGASGEPSTDILAPDGSNLTFKLHWPNGYSSTNNGYARIGNSASDVGQLTAGDYAFSYFVKRGTDGAHNMDGLLVNEGGVGGLSFTAQQFTPYYAPSVSIRTDTNSDIIVEKYPDGWYRISNILFNATQTWTPHNTGVSHYVLAGSNYKTYYEAMPFYYWGMQLEKNPVSTSYIGATVKEQTTRAADSAVIDGENFNEFFNHNGIETNNYQGTLIASMESAAASSPTSGRFNKIQLELNNDNKVQLSTVGGGSPYVDSVISYGSATQIDSTGSEGSTFPTSLKHGIAFAKDNLAYCYNGNTVETDGSANIGSVSTKYTQLTIGGQPTKAHIRRVMYYSQRISDTQLRNLTS